MSLYGDGTKDAIEPPDVGSVLCPPMFLEMLMSLRCRKEKDAAEPPRCRVGCPEEADVVWRCREMKEADEPPDVGSELSANVVWRNRC